MSSGERIAASPQRAGFDDALRDLARRVDSGASDVANVRRLSGGASQETWAFDIVRHEGQRPVILRRAPAGLPGYEYAAGMAAEARLVMAAAAAGVPEPEVLYVLEPADQLGQGFLMSHVTGETLGRRIVRDSQFAAVRPRLAADCGAILAQIHRIGASGLPPLHVRPIAAQRRELREIYGAQGWPRPVFELAFRWLDDNAPDDVPACLVHGDFRNGNLVIDSTGIRAVLDWELAHMGDGAADLAWLCVNSWRFGEIDKPVGGFGTREALFAAYEAGTGQRVDPHRVHYWEVLGTLRWGVLCVRSMDAFRSGADRQPERAMILRRASETELDLLNLLAPRG